MRGGGRERGRERGKERGREMEREREGGRDWGDNSDLIVTLFVFPFLIVTLFVFPFQLIGVLVMKTTWTKREKKVKGETKPHPQHLTALQTITPNVEHVLSTTKQCTAEGLIRHESPQDYRNVIRCVDKALLTQLGRTAPQLSAYGHCSWSM